MGDTECGGFIFSSNFDSGNMAHVELVPKIELPGGRLCPEKDPSDYEFKIWTKPDCAGTEFENGNRTWFYFGIRETSEEIERHKVRIRDTKKNVRLAPLGSAVPDSRVPSVVIKIHIMNLNKQAKLYGQGMAPVCKIVPDKPYWERIKERPTYLTHENNFSLTFKYRAHENPDATTYFAFTFPYTYEELQLTLDAFDNRFKYETSKFEIETESSELEPIECSNHEVEIPKKKLVVRSTNSIKKQATSMQAKRQKDNEQGKEISNCIFVSKERNKNNTQKMQIDVCNVVPKTPIEKLSLHEVFKNTNVPIESEYLLNTIALQAAEIAIPEGTTSTSAFNKNVTQSHVEARKAHSTTVSSPELCLKSEALHYACPSSRNCLKKGTGTSNVTSGISLEVAKNICKHADDIYYYRELLIYSLEKRRIDLLTISSYHNILSIKEERLEHLFPEKNTSRPFKFKNKKIIFLSARVHPGETPSSFVMNGFLNFILKRSDPVAIVLRRMYVFKIIPIINPDGVAMGHYRTDSHGTNLNRVYDKPSLRHHPSVFAARAIIKYYHKGYTYAHTEESKSSTESNDETQEETANINTSCPPLNQLKANTDLIIRRTETTKNNSVGKSAEIENSDISNKYLWCEKCRNKVPELGSNIAEISSFIPQIPVTNTKICRNCRIYPIEEIESNSFTACSRSSSANSSSELHTKTQYKNDLDDIYDTDSTEKEAESLNQKESSLFLYIDMHGHASKRGIFMYGNHIAGNPDGCCVVHELPKIMSLNSLHFHYQACNFSERNMYINEAKIYLSERDRRDGASREGCGRVAVWKATGLLRSYTLECNYNTGRLVNVLPPARYGERHTRGGGIPPKYGPKIFEEVGRAIGPSILDLTDANPNSRIVNSDFRSINGLRESLYREVGLGAKVCRVYRPSVSKITAKKNSEKELCKENSFRRDKKGNTNREPKLAASPTKNKLCKKQSSGIPLNQAGNGSNNVISQASCSHHTQPRELDHPVMGGKINMSKVRVKRSSKVFIGRKESQLRLKGSHAENLPINIAETDSSLGRIGAGKRTIDIQKLKSVDLLPPSKPKNIGFHNMRQPTKRLKVATSVGVIDYIGKKGKDGLYHKTNICKPKALPVVVWDQRMRLFYNSPIERNSISENSEVEMSRGAGPSNIPAALSIKTSLPMKSTTRILKNKRVRSTLRNLMGEQRQNKIEKRKKKKC